MHEQEVEILVDGAKLAGTLTLPAASGIFPAVLMVHGSGPLDRNENMQGQQLDIFNAIALALAQHGIASLRYDKRGCGSSTGDYPSAGHTDLVMDATQCLDALAKYPNVAKDSVYILGHSEGCIIAPQIAQQRAAVTGLILLCPFVEQIESALLRQASQLDKEIDLLSGFEGVLYRVLLKLGILSRPVRQQRKLIRKVLKTDTPVVRFGLSKIEAKWLREILALDPEAIFAATATPMLLIAGSKDLQCNPADIFRIAEITQCQAETMLIEGMTHLLRVDEASPTLTGYARLADEPLEPALIEKIIQWIQQQPTTAV